MSLIPDAVREMVAHQPQFLRATPDGFVCDDEDLGRQLEAKVVAAKVTVKLFRDGQLIHTSDDCGSEPGCPDCNDSAVRRYVRVTLRAGEATYRLDLPPRSAAGLLDLEADLGREGRTLDAADLRLEIHPKSNASGRRWAAIEFAEVA